MQCQLNGAKISIRDGELRADGQSLIKLRDLDKVFVEIETGTITVNGVLVRVQESE